MEQRFGSPVSFGCASLGHPAMLGCPGMLGCVASAFRRCVHGGRFRSKAMRRFAKIRHQCLSAVCPRRTFAWSLSQVNQSCRQCLSAVCPRRTVDSLDQGLGNRASPVPFGGVSTEDARFALRTIGAPAVASAFRRCVHGGQTVSSSTVSLSPSRQCLSAVCPRRTTAPSKWSVATTCAWLVAKTRDEPCPVPVVYGITTLA